jgi:acetylornithine deacetylase
MTIIDRALLERLEVALDMDGAIALLRRVVGRDSVTGNEAAVAEILADELRALGAEGVTLREFLPSRPNVWGKRRGEPGGANVLLVGHTDTVHVRGWRERWAGTERENPFGGAIVGGCLWARGAADLKAGLCTAIEAVRTLDRAQIPLAGDVTLAFVGDEESGEPGTGVSAGMRSFAEVLQTGEIAKPDIAIYVEPTELDIYTAQMGFFIADVLIKGRSAYFGVPEKGVDALKATHAILAALWAHSKALEGYGEHALVGRSFLLVTAINGGGYIAVPGECRFSLIRKLRPGESLDRACEALEAIIHDAISHPDIKVTIDYPAGRDHRLGGTPTEIDPGLSHVRRLIACMRAVAPERARVAGAPFWSEAPFLIALGIPAVYCAPGDIRICHTLEEHVPIEDYRRGILGFAAFLAGAG